MAQYPARTGPIQHDAAAITIDMLQGCRPAERSRLRVSRSALFSVPEVDPFAIETTFAVRPDRSRAPTPTRGPSFFPWSGTTAPLSPEMFAGVAPDRRPRPTTRLAALFGVPDVAPFAMDSLFAMRPERARPMPQRRLAEVFIAPDVSPFTIDSLFATRPDRGRPFLAPRIPQPVSQTSHTAAPQSIEMTVGSTPPTQRYLAPRHDGWQWVTPEVPVFSIEMVLGSHPDKPRVLLGQPAGQPIGETDTIIPPPPPPPPADTGATPGWPGPPDTPGYERGRSQGWINRDYIRQPSQRPTRRVKPVPAPESPVARQPLARVPYVPQGPPLRVPARVVGGTGGVGQVTARLGLVATVVVRPAAGMVAQARSTPATRKMTPAEWFALRIALSDD